MRYSALAFLSVIILAPNFLRAGIETPLSPPKREWTFARMFGTYDRSALQRGFQVYREACASCHSLKHVRYEKLKALGYGDSEVRAIAKSYKIKITNDDGEKTEVPATPDSYFASPWENKGQARDANNGVIPPDLTLIIKAHPRGADYVHALLTSYRLPPPGFKLMPGMYFNPYFSGHQIAMPPSLSLGQVVYMDGTPATTSQMASDVVTFLAWTADPEMEMRKKTGVQVLFFLMVFTTLVSILMHRAWKQVLEKRNINL